MPHRVYDTQQWVDVRARVLARDADRCTVARLIGGTCSARLHVHHVVPVEDGGEPYDEANLITVCASHHPTLEAVRRAVIRELRDGPEQLPRCHHRHYTKEGLEQCRRDRLRRMRERQGRRRAA